MIDKLHDDEGIMNPLEAMKEGQIRSDDVNESINQSEIRRTNDSMNDDIKIKPKIKKKRKNKVSVSSLKK